uniref:Uncharacterized protein n=1 Tax=Trichogramma kaykai TaxID=54128 RepID=A0ABD2WEI2_9HYME
MDDMLKFDEHINIQAQKANKTYIALRALFCNAHLDKKAKIIAYQSLIRPTHARYASHGKSPAYGVGGSINELCNREVTYGADILNAEDMHRIICLKNAKH